MHRNALGDCNSKWNLGVDCLEHCCLSKGRWHEDYGHVCTGCLHCLGYGAENGTWRNWYLSGTTELRDGQFGTPTETAAPDVVGQLTPAMLFDAIAIQVNGPEAWDERLSIDIVLTDVDERYRLRLANGVLTYTAHNQKGSADATLTTTKRALPALALGGLSADGLADAGIEISGDASVLGRLAAVLEPGDKNFAIVTPERPS